MAKENFLLNKFIEIITKQPKGKVLDLGCGSGFYSTALHKLGYDMTAADVSDQFKYRDEIKFVRFDADKKMPFESDFFDYVVLAEIIEHLKDPNRVINDVHRVLKTNGKLFLSTPNILNLKSRMRFLTEGAYEYFREPPLEHRKHCEETGIDVSQIHVTPYRYHELELLLNDCGFSIDGIFTSIYENKGLSFLVPLIKMQLNGKAKRSTKKGGIDYRRINKIMLSPELLYGRQLIIEATKIKKPA